MATSDFSTSLTDDLFVDQNWASTDKKISFSVQESVGALEMLKNEMEEREITLGELFSRGGNRCRLNYTRGSGKV